MDYLEFFDLKEDPFRPTPDPYYFYPSGSHNEALSSFNYIVEQKEGFFMCVGEPGTGKTTLLNTFLNTEKWKDRAGIALVLTPRLSPEEFLLTVLEDLNVKVRNANKNEIIKAFRDFLIENSMLGRRIIIIVDEAHNLPDETLEELRLLSNLETDKEKLLQIILIGQPELRKRLLSEKLKQLNQRIAVRTELRPLTAGETSDYINYRLIKAGKGNIIFEEQTKKFIHKLSRGIPRLINLISSRAMMAAYLDMSRNVKKRHVKYAVKHISDNLIKTKKRLIVFSRAVLLIILFVAVNVMFILNKDMFVRLLSNNFRQSGNQTVDSRQQTINVTQDSGWQSSAKGAEQGMGSGKNSSGLSVRKVEVIADIANLRASPSDEAAVVKRVLKGVQLEITDEFTEVSGKKWFKVKLRDGRECWIAERVVKNE